MLKKIYEFIDYNMRDNKLFQVICTCLVGVICFVLTFIYVIDSTPATNEDYEPLIKQNKAISENFNTVYTYDNYLISPNDSNIKVELSNDECKLSCTYDNNLKFINYKKIDLADSKLIAIIGSLFLGIIGGVYIGGFIISIIIPHILYYLLRFLEWICLLLVGRR